MIYPDKISAESKALSTQYQLQRQAAEDADLLKKTYAAQLINQLYQDGAVAGTKGGQITIDSVIYQVAVRYDCPNADKYDTNGRLKKLRDNAKHLSSLYRQALAAIQDEIANIVEAHPKIKSQMQISIATQEDLMHKQNKETPNSQRATNVTLT